GILLTKRPHLSELAAGRHARLGAGLRDAARADAPEAHGSLTEVLEAGRERLSGLPGVARIPPRPLAFLARQRRQGFSTEYAGTAVAPSRTTRTSRRRIRIRIPLWT